MSFPACLSSLIIECLYGNRCLANRAGFAPSECKPVSCPPQDNNAGCSLEYDPIICNSKLVSSGITCSYSNACLAQAAGYTTEAHAGQCIFASSIQPGRSVQPQSTSETDATEAPEGTGSAAPPPMMQKMMALVASSAGILAWFM